MNGQGTVASAWGASLLVTALMLGAVSLLDSPPSGSGLDTRPRQGSAVAAALPVVPGAAAPAAIEMAAEGAAGDDAPPACG